MLPGPDSGLVVDKTRILELEAPEILPIGGNFYDQPPFAEILAKYSHQGLHLDGLRTLITSLSKKLVSVYPEVLDPANLTTVDEIKVKMKELLIRSKNLREKMHESAIGLPNADSLLNELLVYPCWYEYVSNHCLAGVYSSDGSYQNKSKQPTSDISYAYWAAKRLKTEQLTDLNEIEKQFRRNQSGADMSAGVGRATRTWRIMNASELTNKRR